MHVNKNYIIVSTLTTVYSICYVFEKKWYTKKTLIHNSLANLTISCVDEETKTNCVPKEVKQQKLHVASSVSTFFFFITD